MYYIDVRHEGLNKFRRIKGSDRFVVEEKARRQMATWDEQWSRKQAADAKRLERENATLAREKKKELAGDQTREAQEAISAIEAILEHRHSLGGSFDWDALKRKDTFQVTKPELRTPTALPIEPKREDSEFTPDLGLMDRLISSRRRAKEKVAEEQFRLSHREWESVAGQVEQENRQDEVSFASELERWESERCAFEEKVCAHNQAVDELRTAYAAGDSEAVAEYCEAVLSLSEYPEVFPSEFDVEYRPAGRIVLVDYQLPAPDALPRLREVKYVQSRDEFKESGLSDSQLNKLYDSCLYQITLRTIYELVESDQVDAIDVVLFNGWVRSVDKATGNEATACVLSLQVAKDEFQTINLSQVDPRACFKALKGVGSAKLHGLAPVRPILELAKDDSRFVNAREVVAGLDEGDNLAAMDWEDFEHLIREVFEQEFAQSGGEVKITQASRDRGVDAVAFDPDPVRGGKIVIQAKRYTNTVGVSAVRDLYGTVMNEGAMKGILVSTSDYGPDAYEFARDKPLTLLSGANLLHMLGKHGHKARIDLQEAKALQRDE